MNDGVNTDNCWLFAGHLNRDGYGRIFYKSGRMLLVHRAVYMETFGSIPDGYEIDHRGSPALFNPEGLPISTPHTEEMTRLVNQAAKERIKELGGKDNE